MKESTFRGLDEFELAYFEAALWSTSNFIDERYRDDNCPPCLDEDRDVSDIPEALAQEHLEECRDFREAESGLLAQSGDDSQNGRDFWLTRERHGTGFWDRGYGDVGDKLTDACRPYGSGSDSFGQHEWPAIEED